MTRNHGYFQAAIVGLTLLAAGCAPPAAQESATARVIAQYSGFYACAQGTTDLILQVLDRGTAPQYRAVFNFGPNKSNPDIPNGAYVVQGAIEMSGGQLDLRPVSWISQPKGYTMVGLAGASADGGTTFEGRITLGYGCTNFSLRRTAITS